MDSRNILIGLIWKRVYRRDDFFTYANGTWLKEHAVPASEVWWGDAKISDNDNFKKIKLLLTDAASGCSSDRMEKMVGAMYKSGMDTVSINKLGITPIQPDLARISTIKTTSDLLAEIALEQTMGLYPALSFSVSPDLKNSKRLINYFMQSLHFKNIGI